jgi:hypothetical protein
MKLFLFVIFVLVDLQTKALARAKGGGEDGELSNTILAIFKPMIYFYTALYVMLSMRANPLRGRGLGPGNLDSFGPQPNGTRLMARCHLTGPNTNSLL